MFRCGSAIEFTSNEFIENAPISHASNGGAVSLECDFVSEEAVSRRRGGASSFFANDMTHYMLDPEDQSVKYLMFDVSSIAFRSNLFQGNSIGQKGGAIYAR